jgi:hypothetical protein
MNGARRGGTSKPNRYIVAPRSSKRKLLTPDTDHKKIFRAGSNTVECSATFLFGSQF